MSQDRLVLLYAFPFEEVVHENFLTEINSLNFSYVLPFLSISLSLRVMRSPCHFKTVDDGSARLCDLPRV